MATSDKYTFQKVSAGYAAARDERTEFETEWRRITDYLLPGRGIYQTYSKPRKRKLTSPKVINSIAEDALGVLTSGMHGGLTSPSRVWFKLEWLDPKIQGFDPLKAWIQDATDRLHKALHGSNFYSIINSFYYEYAGFGNAALYVGEDTEDIAIDPFRFELLTVGEYAVVLDSKGLIAGFYRTIFMTPRQLVHRFGNKVAKEWRTKVSENQPSADNIYISVLEYVCKDTYQDKPYRQMYFDQGAVGKKGVNTEVIGSDALANYGFYEMPYMFGRWSTIGADVYGIGPGSRALPDIMRAQEMEKALLMGAHKTVDPPLNVPARQRGKLNALPGGRNYYANPNEVVTEMYRVNFDFAGVSGVIERVEERIQKNFFNDIFLTGSRDPNASPLRTGQVQAQEQEKMLRLGPIIERLQHEVFMPMIERCFNIMLRKQMFEQLPPDLAEMAGDYKISLVSPLATAQRMVAMGGINSFMSFIGGAAQFNQEILDNIDVDKAAREVADISGVDLGILRPEEEVKGIRESRQQAQQEEKAKAEAMAANDMQNQTANADASSRAQSAQAGKTLAETQEIVQGL